ncbi:DUF2147 domain-containing protein [Aquimarina sp. SS2-1]|uniref:DUF2147 domain-containing protein n=1 Tax=Aquimarina besae TaxID=3342247 RepID=UPI003672FF9B
MRYIFILLFCKLYVTTITPETYKGKWQIEGGSVIEIYEYKNQFFGKINKRAEKPISNLNGLDNNNPDFKLRQRQLVGINILNNLSFEGGELAGGTIYNADSGKTYAVKVWIDSDNTDLCYIRAYKGILFKTFEAIRVKD